MASTLKPKNKVELTSRALALVDILKKSGAEEAAVVCPPGVEQALKQELIRKGLLKIVDGGKGKGNAGKLQLIAPLPEIVQTTRAARGSKSKIPRLGPSASKEILVPTPEQMLELLSLLKETEESIKGKVSDEATRAVDEIQKALSAETDHNKVKVLYQDLGKALERLDGLEADVRVQAFDVIRNSTSGAVARFINHLSPTFTNKP